MSVIPCVKALKVLLLGTALAVTGACGRWADDGGSVDAEPIRIALGEAEPDQLAANLIRGCAKETREYYEGRKAKGSPEDDIRAELTFTATGLVLSDRESAARRAAEWMDVLARDTFAKYEDDLAWGKLADDMRLQAEWNVCVAGRRIEQLDERAIAYSPLESLAGRWSLDVDCPNKRVLRTIDGPVASWRDDTEPWDYLVTLETDQRGWLRVLGELEGYWETGSGAKYFSHSIYGTAAPVRKGYVGTGEIGQEKGCEIRVRPD